VTGRNNSSRVGSSDAPALEAIRTLSGRFFAAPAGAPRDRHPTDVILLVFASVLVAIFAFRAGTAPGDLEQSLIDLMASLPGLFDPLWNISHDALVVWGFLLIALALLRRQWKLVASLAMAAAAVIVLGPVIGRLSSGDWPPFEPSLFKVTQDVYYPSVALAFWVSVSSVTSPHLSRPFRFFGRWVVTGAGFSAFALGISAPGATVGAMALGLGVAAAVHLLLGSPANLPNLDEVQRVLASMGVPATPTTVSRRNGVVRVRAEAADGTDMDVKIYGRDAWDGQFLVTLWRHTWYRQGSRTLALSRIQQVEHEAFLTLLAQQRDVPTFTVVAAGKNVIGDAVLVVKRRGELLVDAVDLVTDDQVVAMWQALADLHAAGITHGAIDATHVFIEGDTVGFADLSSGQVLSDPVAPLIDRAQMLVATSTLVGMERAIAAAVQALGREGLGDVSSAIQPAALTPLLRKSCDAVGLDIDDLRAAAVDASGGEQRDLQKLRRVTLGGLFTVALLFIAGNVLISGLIDIGIDTIVDAIRQASLPILILAFGISCMGRVSNAVALSGMSPTPIPLGRLTALQFAMTFVGLAMPSTAGRVAVNIRFFQRAGVEPTTAVAIGALDGFTGFLCQMFLMGTILLFGLGSLNITLSEDFDVEAAKSLILWLLVILVIAIIVIFAVSRIRNWLFELVRKVRDFVVPLLHSPRRLVVAFCGNLVSELIGALTQFTVLIAFGQDVNYFDVVLVAITVSLFAGLMPVPGGIGVTEAALTAGFISIGVPADIAFAAALTCRMITFYLPPVIGIFVFRWMQKQRYL
jgi:glycosyltransferase 2 family protein